MRAEEYCSNKDSTIALVVNEIIPNDIDQGELGDCYFCCSLASMAEFPDLIKNIFKHPEGEEVAKKERKIGAYSMLLNKNGWTSRYYVDNYLPVDCKSLIYAHHTAEPGELWVALLEKLYAKLHGSYYNIAEGIAIEALQDLTGFPAGNFFPLIKSFISY